jgi:hypothetical protein
MIHMVDNANMHNILFIDGWKVTNHSRNLGLANGQKVKQYIKR